MSNTTLKPIALALGAAFATSLAGGAYAAENPFSQSELSSGYMVAGKNMEGKCGEGKCGGMGDKSKGESKCGAKMMDTDGDGNVTREEFMSSHEKMFKSMDTDGDGVLSNTEMHGKSMKEGKCGGDKTMKEGKCGEGKCGGKK